MPDNKPGSLEDRIRVLCAKVVESSDEESLRGTCAELRLMLSEHIALLRARALELKLKELASERKITQMDPGKKGEGQGSEGSSV